MRALFGLVLVVACGSDPETQVLPAAGGSPGSGGAPASGGTESGGTAGQPAMPEPRVCWVGEQLWEPCDLAAGKFGCVPVTWFHPEPWAVCAYACDGVQPKLDCAGDWGDCVAYGGESWCVPPGPPCETDEERKDCVERGGSCREHWSRGWRCDLNP
jgi:hypothetical protein